MGGIWRRCAGRPRWACPRVRGPGFTPARATEPAPPEAIRCPSRWPWGSRARHARLRQSPTPRPPPTPAVSGPSPFSSTLVPSRWGQVPLHHPFAPIKRVPHLHSRIHTPPRPRLAPPPSSIGAPTASSRLQTVPPPTELPNCFTRPHVTSVCHLLHCRCRPLRRSGALAAAEQRRHRAPSPVPSPTQPSHRIEPWGS
jgi:hypothetical protein